MEVEVLGRVKNKAVVEGESYDGVCVVFGKLFHVLYCNTYTAPCGSGPVTKKLLDHWVADLGRSSVMPAF
jgi:hypothetical protein